MTVHISHEGKLELLPEEIRNLIPKWREAAIASGANWYEKYASIKFSYEGVDYILGPRAVGLNHYLFADAMLGAASDLIIEDLKNLGAIDACYTGMPD